MEISARCSEATFILIWEEEVERIEGVGRFKYLGRLLDWSDDNWPEVLCNISKERQLWVRLGKILWRKGAEPTVSEKFYRAVVHGLPIV